MKEKLKSIASTIGVLAVKLARLGMVASYRAVRRLFNGPRRAAVTMIAVLGVSATLGIAAINDQPSASVTVPIEIRSADSGQSNPEPSAPVKHRGHKVN